MKTTTDKSMKMHIPPHLLGLLAAAGIVYVLLDLLIDLPPSGLEFHSEVVTAIPKEDSITFDCEFHFLSHHGRRKSYEVGFVFRDSNAGPPPEKADVTADGKPLSFRTLSQGLVFDLPVKPKQETVLRIQYALEAPDRKAVYITRTANLWPKPMSSARFVIPEGVVSNYHEEGRLEIEFKDFRPKENWFLRWGE